MRRAADPATRTPAQWRAYLDVVEGGRPDDYLAACPVHGGSSLHVSVGAKQPTVIKCFGGECSFAEIVEAVEAAPGPIRVRRRASSTDGAPHRPSGSRVVAEHVYRDAAGSDVFRVVRLDPKSFRQERWDGRRWVRGLAGAATVPYRLPELLAAAADEVYVVDGEKDADRLASMGVVATCSPMGMERWRDEWGAYLRDGARAVVVQDRDDGPGERGARVVRRSLARHGVDVRVVQAAVGKDVSDHLDAGMTLDELLPGDALVAIPLVEVERRDPEPLLLGRLDPQDHTVLFGDGGTGKGVVAAWWAARLTVEDPRAVVLVLDYERHARFEWRPRVEAFGGDMRRVLIAQPEEPIWDVVEDVEAEATRQGATYLIVDSASYATGDAEIEKSTTATRYSRAVSAIGLPVLSLAHTTKQDADPKHPFGSVFWSNGARVTIGVARKAEAPDSPRVLKNKKTNQRAPFAPVEIDWSWALGDLPPRLNETRHDERLADRLVEAVHGLGWKTADEAATLATQDGGDPVTKEQARQAMNDDSRFEREGRGRGSTTRYRCGIAINRVPNLLSEGVAS
ncbi:MAG: AAA family ATPase [Chloroflexota bacterium]